MSEVWSGTITPIHPESATITSPVWSGTIVETPRPAAPVITSMNFTQGDPAGGGTNVVIHGTGLSTASVLFGAAAAGVVATSDTSITCTLPAHVAGVISVTATTLGGTSAGTAFEFWYPGTDASCTYVFDTVGGGFSVDASGNATWTRRFGSRDFTEFASNAPHINSSGEPVFNAADPNTEDLFTYNNPKIGTFFKLTGGSAGACAIVFNPAGTPTTHNALPYQNPGLFMDYLRGAIGMTFSSAGVEAFLTDGTYKTTSVALSVDGNRHLGMMRFQDGTSLDARVDGSAWAPSSTAIGTFPAVTTTDLVLGANYQSSELYNGAMSAAVWFNSKISDATATKIYQWARQRYGVA